MQPFGQFGDYDLDKRREALQRLRQIRQNDLPALRRELADAVGKARTHRDDRLTEQALGERRREIETGIRAKGKERLDELTREANRCRSTVHSGVGEIGKAPSDPTEALLSETRQSKSWERARTQLDNGAPVHRVIAQAEDVDAVQGLKAELPGWLTGGRHDQDLSVVERTLNARLAEVVGGAQGRALKMSLECDTVTPGMEVAMNGLRGDVEAGVVNSQVPTGGGLHAAFEAHRVDAVAADTLGPDTEEEPAGGMTSERPTGGGLHAAFEAHLAEAAQTSGPDAA